MSVLIQCIKFDFESSLTTVSGRPLWSGSTPPAAVLCHREDCPSDAQGRLKLDENLYGIDIKLTPLYSLLDIKKTVQSSNNCYPD